MLEKPRKKLVSEKLVVIKFICSELLQWIFSMQNYYKKDYIIKKRLDKLERNT